MGTCDWPVDSACLPELPDGSDTGYEQALATRTAATSLAVQVMWSLSGRQFGICEYIARPCPTIPWYRRRRVGYSAPFVVIYDSGTWLNAPCGCLGNCNIVNPRTIHLPGPVAEIVSVSLGDTILDADQWTMEGDVLYRIGADWPSQDLSLPMGSAGTWSVDYMRGQSVPTGVDRLTGLLAKEFMSACDGDTRCRLPRTVVSTTRQGVTHVFDPTRILATGKTGLPEIDSWLAAVNPYRLLAPPQVL